MPANSTDEQLLEELNTIISNNSNENWTLDDFLEKDPEALDNMFTQNPERLKKLNAEYFSKELRVGSKPNITFEGIVKEQLQEAKKELMNLTLEQKIEFIEQDSEGYKKIMEA